MSSWALALAAFAATGLLSGLAAGLLGVGGGLVIVPALIFTLSLLGPDWAPPADALTHVAVGTSLAAIVFTAISSTRAHHRRGGVRWEIWKAATPGLLIGAMLGAAIADALPGDVLRRVFALFEFAVAAQLAFGSEPGPHRRLPGVIGIASGAGVIGTVSSLLGIGGGTLSVPAMRWCGVAMHQAVGTAAAMGLPIAVAGATGFLLAGSDVDTGVAQLGYVSWPALVVIASVSLFTAPLGARLAYRLSARALRLVFALFLALVAIRLGWS